MNDDISLLLQGYAAMNPNKALWEKGDFTRIARSMRESGEALVQSLRLTKGLKVLDLGCGDGTTALPAARLGADVLGVDIAQNVVDAGNRRALTTSALSVADELIKFCRLALLYSHNDLP